MIGLGYHGTTWTYRETPVPSDKLNTFDSYIEDALDLLHEVCSYAWGTSDGVLLTGTDQELLVEELVTPAMSVKVRTGFAWISKFIFKLTSDTNLSVIAPISYPRIDIVQAKLSDWTVEVKQGIENPSPTAPGADANCLKLAEIYCRVGMTVVRNTDDGTNGYISDYRPLYIPLVNAIDRLKPYVSSPPDQKVNVEAGDVFASGQSLIEFTGGNVNLGPSGAPPTPAMTASWYNKVLISLDPSGALTYSFSSAQATEGALTDPDFIETCIPIALVTVQDDGSGTPGSILPIFRSEIQDVRPYLNLGGGLVSEVLQAEYPGAVLYGDGVNNDPGTEGMTSDMEKEGDYWYNYYEWSSSLSSGLQDYDIIIRWKVPDDFVKFKEGVNQALKVDFSTEECLTTNNKIDVRLYKDGVSGELASSLDNVVINEPGNWQTAQEGNLPIAFDDSNLSSLTAGDTLIIDIKLYSQNSKYARVGAITLNYWRT